MYMLRHCSLTLSGPKSGWRPRLTRSIPATNIVLGVFLFFSSTVVSAQSRHDRAFWQAIVKNQYAVPERESADSMAEELSGLLASPDPELRDDFAYAILTNWIYRRNLLSHATLIGLTDAWRASLRDGLGETGTNSVLKRSFSALCLSSMAAREAKASFMGAQRYHQLVSEAMSYLQAERDLRGYDAKLHWIHATAHTADLLAALANNPQLTREESAGILSTISTRLATAPRSTRRANRIASPPQFLPLSVARTLTH